MRKFIGTVFAMALWAGVVGPARADDQADARKVIDKAIQAIGGEAKLAKYPATVWKTKGTFHGLGNPIPYTGDYASQLPDKLRVTIEFDAGGQQARFTMVFNKDKGWRTINDNTMDMDQEQVAEQKENLYAQNVSHLLVLKDKAYTLSPLGEVKVDNKPAVGVKVSQKGHRDVNLFFDKDKGFLVKVETRVKDEMTGQEVNQETLLSDYKEAKEANGLKYPAKVVIKRAGQLYVESEDVEHQFKEKLEDRLFEKPS